MTHLKTSLYFISFVLISFGCSEKNTAGNVEREASIHVGTKATHEKFTLSLYHNADTLNYRYVSKADSTKSMHIKKIENSNSLFLGGEKFTCLDTSISGSKEFIDLEFEVYQTEHAGDDATGPILFNSEYGLLCLYNVFGPTIIFLEKTDPVLTEQIIQSLRE
jgi:hypothetical protein